MKSHSPTLPTAQVTTEHITVLGPAIRAHYNNTSGKGAPEAPVADLKRALWNYLEAQPSRMRRAGEAMLNAMPDDLLAALRKAVMSTPLPAPLKQTDGYKRIDLNGKNIHA